MKTDDLPHLYGEDGDLVDVGLICATYLFNVV